MSGGNDTSSVPTRSQKVDNVKTGVEALVIVVALVACILRFYTRIYTRVGLGCDDWFILTAVCFTLTTAAFLLAATSINPNGTWVADNTNSDYVYTSADVIYLKLSFISSVLYFTIASTTKLGILLMYNRLFSVDRPFRRRLYVVSSLVIIFWIGTTVASFTNCIPLDWSWKNGLADPRYCFNYNIFWMASGSCEVFLDVIILMLPVQIVLRLQMSARNKATILLIFFLGGFTVITGVVRVVLGYVPGSRVPSYSRTEVWTTVHAGLAIICACLPILRPLLTRVTKAKSQLIAKISKTSSTTSTPSMHRKRKSLPWSIKRNNTHKRDNSESALLEKSLLASTQDSELQDLRSEPLLLLHIPYDLLLTSPSPTLPPPIPQTSSFDVNPPTSPPPIRIAESAPLLRSTQKYTIFPTPPPLPPAPPRPASIHRRPLNPSPTQPSPPSPRKPPTPPTQPPPPPSSSSSTPRRSEKPVKHENTTSIESLPPLTRLTLNLGIEPITFDDMPYFDV